MKLYLRPHLLKLILCFARKQSKKKLKKSILICENFKKIKICFTIQETEAISFHLRHCVLKPVENFLKHSTLDIFSSPVAQKCFFGIKGKHF